MNVLKKYLQEIKSTEQESKIESCLESSRTANDFIRCCRNTKVASDKSDEELVARFREYNNPNCPDKNKPRRLRGRNRRY